jgi:hypothetical protein
MISITWCGKRWANQVAYLVSATSYHASAACAYILSRYSFIPKVPPPPLRRVCVCVIVDEEVLGVGGVEGGPDKTAKKS